MILNRRAKAALLAQAIAHAVAGPVNGLLDLAKVMLWTGSPPLNDTTDVSGLAEAAYPGYARLTITWGPVHTRPDGSLCVDTNLIVAQMSDNTTPTTITGWSIVDGADSTHVLGSEQFANAINLNTTADAVSFVGQVALTGQDWGMGTQVP